MANRRSTSAKGKRPSQRRGKKKNSNKYLYIAMGFLAIGIILIAFIISLSSDGSDNENTEEPSDSSEASDISTNESDVIDIIDKGWKTNDDGTKSYLDEKGEPYTGAMTINGETYVFSAEGIMQSGDWAKDGEDYYYLGADGKAVVGFQEIGGHGYYFFDDGAMATGLIQAEGNSYYFDDNGIMQKDAMIPLNGETYYFDSNGSMKTGWLEKDGNKYYFEADGKMAIGQTEIDGKNHFFSSKGAEFIVANPWNAVCSEDEEYPVELVTLPSGYGDARKGKVDASCYDDLMAMMDACYSITGRDVYVVSGHRTYDYQAGNYKREVNSYLSQGYSQEEAERLAAEWVAPPGTSEHHLGLAVDIIDSAGSLNQNQEKLEGQQWLMAHSWEYGFILRYPADGKDSTGINYEPWHYRYLGKELAAEVYNSGLTLEEYIESLG